MRGGLGFRVRGGYGEWPAWWPGWAAGLLGRSPGVIFLFLLVLFSVLFLFFLFIFLLLFYF